MGGRTEAHKRKICINKLVNILVGAAEALEHFQQDRNATSFPLLSHIPELIFDEENTVLGAIIPDGEEVKNVVFRLNNDSSSTNGLTGRFFHVCRYCRLMIDLTGIFFHVCWDIVGLDIIRMVQDFFAFNTLLKSIIHIHLVLFPKKKNVRSFSNMRPISLNCWDIY